MDVTLSPELERFVEEKVKAGGYRTPSEVIRDGLQLLKELDEEGGRSFDSVKQEISLAVAQADRGEMEDVDEGLASRIRTAGIKKLNAWRNGNGG